MDSCCEDRTPLRRFCEVVRADEVRQSFRSAGESETDRNWLGGLTGLASRCGTGIEVLRFLAEEDLGWRHSTEALVGAMLSVVDES